MNGRAKLAPRQGPGRSHHRFSGQVWVDFCRPPLNWRRLSIIAGACLFDQSWMGTGPPWGVRQGVGAQVSRLSIDQRGKPYSRQPPAEPSTIPHVCI